MSRTSGNSQPVDSVLFASVLFLLGLGIVMVYSSSAIMAYKTYGNSAHFLIRSLIYATGGLAIMIVISRVPSWVWSKASKYLLVFSIILLVLTLIFGTKAKGATRWIRIAGFSFQPTELAKVAYIIFLAKSLSKLSKNGFRGEKMIRNLMPQILVFAIFAVLFLCQPDLGSTLLLAAILLIALFLSGLSLKYMFVAILLVTPLGLLAVMHRSYRIRRVLGWLNPLQFKQDIGYQLSESWMTIGSGGWFGQGLGNGNYKLMFLPEAHTDFIFAAIGAELGFVGMIAVILVFVTFLFKGLLISLGQKDLFNFYLGFLIVSLISLQAAVNIAVVTGVLPTKGFTLPLISYGGSSLWANCFMVGILLNLSRRKSEKSSSKLNQSERIPSYG